MSLQKKCLSVRSYGMPLILVFVNNLYATTAVIPYVLLLFFVHLGKVPNNWLIVDRLLVYNYVNENL